MKGIAEMVIVKAGKGKLIEEDLFDQTLETTLTA
jgi:hypothetical protein